jgi:hypothetical protein
MCSACACRRCCKHSGTLRGFSQPEKTRLTRVCSASTVGLNGLDSYRRQRAVLQRYPDVKHSISIAQNTSSRVCCSSSRTSGRHCVWPCFPLLDCAIVCNARKSIILVMYSVCSCSCHHVCVPLAGSRCALLPSLSVRSAQASISSRQKTTLNRVRLSAAQGVQNFFGFFNQSRLPAVPGDARMTTMLCWHSHAAFGMQLAVIRHKILLQDQTTNFRCDGFLPCVGPSSRLGCRNRR